MLIVVPAVSLNKVWDRPVSVSRYGDDCDRYNTMLGSHVLSWPMRIYRLGQKLE